MNKPDVEHGAKRSTEWPWKKYIKSKNIPLDKTIPLYIALTVFVGIMVCRRMMMLIPSLSAGAYWAFYTAFSLLMPIAYVLPQSGIKSAMDLLGSYWMCYQFTASAVALLDALAEVVLGILRVHFVYYDYTAIACYLAAFALTLYGILHARHLYVTKYTCKLSRQGSEPGAGRNLRIAHLSDLHLGSVNNNHAMRRIVRKVNALQPDMVCITGDTFTESVGGVPNPGRIAETLAGMQSTYGTFACLGNHDYGNDYARMQDFFRKADIRVLQDECAELDGCHIIGREDIAPSGKVHERQEIASLVPADAGGKPIVVMNHQPAEMQEAAAAGVDITLCGHTHGGQFFPIQLAVRRVFPHYKGMKKYGSMYGIISTGSFAAVPPIRIGSKSQIIAVDVC